MWKSAVKVSLADHAAGAGSASTAYYCAASAAMRACRPGLQGNPGFHCISFAVVAGLIKVSSMDKDGQGSCIPASEMVRAVLISSGRAFDPSLNFILVPCLLCLAVISHAFRGSLTPCRQKRALGALLLSWPAHLLLSLLFRSNRPMLNHS
jgi:hypothetical protein